LGELGFELVDLLHAHVAAFAHLAVLLEAHRAAAHAHRVPRKHVFGQVDALGRLGNAAVLHAKELVEEVRVAVVEPHAERPVQDALARGHEARFLQRHVVGHRRHRPREDVLAKPQNGERQRLAALGRLELFQQVAVLERFFEVPVLVHVNRLHVLAPCEHHGVVLVFRLALAQARVAGQLHAVHVLHRTPVAVRV
jgi:hypothetical protein